MTVLHQILNKNSRFSVEIAVHCNFLGLGSLSTNHVPLQPVCRKVNCLACSIRSKLYSNYIGHFIKIQKNAHMPTNLSIVNMLYILSKSSFYVIILSVCVINNLAVCVNSTKPGPNLSVKVRP